MPVHVKDGGVWKEAVVFVRDGGVWKQADLSVRDGGVWKEAVSFTPTITLTYTFASDTVGQVYLASITVGSNGTVSAVGPQGKTANYSWIDDAAYVGDYEVRATLVSGSAPSGTVGSWIDCASGATWSRSSSTYGVTKLTVEIRDKATQTIQASATFDIETGS